MGQKIKIFKNARGKVCLYWFEKATYQFSAKSETINFLSFQQAIFVGHFRGSFGLSEPSMGLAHLPWTLRNLQGPSGTFQDFQKKFYELFLFLKKTGQVGEMSKKYHYQILLQLLTQLDHQPNPSKKSYFQVSD